jgi:hypothetical protein
LASILDRCQPCKELTPRLEQAVAAVEGVKLAKLNVDVEADIAGQLRVDVLPTLFLICEVPRRPPPLISAPKPNHSCARAGQGGGEDPGHPHAARGGGAHRQGAQGGGHEDAGLAQRDPHRSREAPLPWRARQGRRPLHPGQPPPAILPPASPQEPPSTPPLSIIPPASPPQAPPPHSLPICIPRPHHPSTTPLPCARGGTAPRRAAAPRRTRARASGAAARGGADRARGGGTAAHCPAVEGDGAGRGRGCTRLRSLVTRHARRVGRSCARPVSLAALPAGAARGARHPRCPVHGGPGPLRNGAPGACPP